MSGVKNDSIGLFWMSSAFSKSGRGLCSLVPSPTCGLGLERTAGTVWQHGNTREDPKKLTFFGDMLHMC